jgi:cystathionine beta-lyase/cystathionine gamma-synthase
MRTLWRGEFLESHPKVEKVVYPGLSSHPQHQIAGKRANAWHGRNDYFLY